MKTERKERLSVRVSPRLHALVTAAGSHAGMSQAQIIEAALEGFFAVARDDDRDAGIMERLDRMTRQLARLERNDMVHGESITLFLKFMFTVTPKLTQAELDAALRLADKRFADFIGRMKDQLGSGRRVLQAALEEVLPEPEDFASIADIGADQPSRRRRHPESRVRETAMLRTAFGPAIAAALDDPGVIEVMVIPDGRLWLDRQQEGRVCTGVSVGQAEAERVIRLVASHIRADVSRDAPIVSAELPGRGERFEGVLPPVATAPCFAIRKSVSGALGLDDYVTQGVMTAAQADALRAAVRDRANVLVAGGTSSGKTTLANALLREIAASGDRVVILEDTRELHCAAEDVVALRTRADAVSLADLVRSTLRLRPDRVIVGEVRGPEALDLLKAWNTGHPGGIATLHANGARAALTRLEQLVQEAVVTVPKALIAEAIDVVVFLAGRGAARRVETLARVEGLRDGDYALIDLVPRPEPGKEAS